MQSVSLQFHKTVFHPIERGDGRLWLRGHEIGEALGYANGQKAINNLYNANAGEFSDTMTCILETRMQGQNRSIRAFSLRGAYLLAMKATTDRAIEFRSWALDALEAASAAQTQHVEQHGQGAWVTFDEVNTLVDAGKADHPEARRKAVEVFNRIGQPSALDLTLAREIGQLKDVVAAQNQAILALYQQVDGARLGHIRALGKLLTLQERQQKLLVAQEKANARETIIQLEAEGVPRSVIATRTGRTFNHIRQVIWQARQDGRLPAHQGELALGDAA